jgi:hypothetical protein
VFGGSGFERLFLVLNTLHINYNPSFAFSLREPLEPIGKISWPVLELAPNTNEVASRHIQHYEVMDIFYAKLVIPQMPSLIQVSDYLPV